MIIVHATTSIALESREAFLEEARRTIAASLAEDGCVTYTCSEDVTSPGTFHWVEEWADLDRFNAHAEAAHHLDFIRALGDETRIVRSTSARAAYYDTEPLDGHRRATMGFSTASNAGHIPR